jgi:hypothetical protein
VIAWQTIKDRFSFPLLVFLSSAHARALGLTPIDEERVAMALGRCRGLVLDIGCGTNELGRRYRSRQGMAVEVEIYPRPGADAVCDTNRTTNVSVHSSIIEVNAYWLTKLAPMTWVQEGVVPLMAYG